MAADLQAKTLLGLLASPSALLAAALRAEPLLGLLASPSALLALPRRVAGLVVLAAALAGCAAAVAPTYSQDELRATCERTRGVWHADALTGGFCEYRAA
jgi:hypothetical protein